METGLSSKKLLKWSESSKEDTARACEREREREKMHTHIYTLYSD